MIAELVRRLKLVETRLERLIAAEQGTLPCYAYLACADGTTSQSVSATPAKVTGFTTVVNQVNMTASASTDDITVTYPGLYAILFQSAFSGSVSTQFDFHLRIDGAEQTAGFHRVLGSGGDVGSGSFLSIRSLTAGQIITVYVEAPSGSKSITPVDMQLIVFKVART